MRRDADDELETLIACRVEHLIARGMSPDDACAEAIRRLGASLDPVRHQLHTHADRRERRMRVACASHARRRILRERAAGRLVCRARSRASSSLRRRRGAHAGARAGARARLRALARCAHRRAARGDHLVRPVAAPLRRRSVDHRTGHRHRSRAVDDRRRRSARSSRAVRSGRCISSGHDRGRRAASTGNEHVVARRSPRARGHRVACHGGNVDAWRSLAIPLYGTAELDSRTTGTFVSSPGASLTAHRRLRASG